MLVFCSSVGSKLFMNAITILKMLFLFSCWVISDSVTPWTTAFWAPLSFSLRKFMSIESIMLSSHLICCSLLLCLQSFPASGSFQMHQLFTSGGQNIAASASASVLSMNIQGWFPLGWTALISFQSKGLSRVFSSTTIQKHQFFSS